MCLRGNVILDFYSLDLLRFLKKEVSMSLFIFLRERRGKKEEGEVFCFGFF